MTVWPADRRTPTAARGDRRRGAEAVRVDGTIRARGPNAVREDGGRDTAAAVPFLLSYLARLAQRVQEAMDARSSPDSLDFLGTKDPGAHRAN